MSQSQPLVVTEVQYEWSVSGAGFPAALYKQNDGDSDDSRRRYKKTIQEEDSERDFIVMNVKITEDDRPLFGPVRMEVHESTPIRRVWTKQYFVWLSRWEFLFRRCISL